MVPAVPPGFVERLDAGHALVKTLTSGRKARTVAVVGPGGFGKNILAQWACHQAAVRERFPDGVLWVQLSGRDGLAEYTLGILTDFITRLTGTREAYGCVEVAADAFAAALGELRILLVLDGVWRLDDARWFLAGGARCTRLLTTQQRLPLKSAEIHVASMTREEAALLLGRELPASAGEVLAPLLDRAAGYPLVIALLNGLLRSLQGLPMADAIDEITARLDRQGPGVLDELSDTAGIHQVRRTLEASLAELAATAPGGQEAVDRYAFLAAFPAGAVIRYSLLERLWAVDPVEVRLRCQRFLDRSLISSAGDDGIRVHDIVRAQVRCLFPGLAVRTSRDLLDAVRPASGWHALPAGLREDLAGQLAYHLVQAERTDELGGLFCDFRYLLTRIRWDGLVSLEADLEAYIASAGDDGGSARLLLGLLRREANILHGADVEEHDLALTLHSRLLGRFRAEHVQDAMPRHGLILERPLPYHAGARLARSLTGHHGQVSCVTWQADGLLLSAGGDDGTLRRWHPGTGIQHSELPVFEDLILRAQLSPDGRHLAVLAHKNPAGSGWPRGTLLRIQVIDTAAGVTAGTRYLSVRDLIRGSRLEFAWAPDSSVLAIAGTDKIRFWSPFRKRHVRSLPAEGPFRALSWHKARGLAGLTWYGSVTAWPDPLTSDRSSSVSLFDSAVTVRTLAWSPDGNRIAVAADDQLYMVETTRNGDLRGVWGGLAWFWGSPAAVAWHPDSRTLAVAWNHVLPGVGSMITLCNITSPGLWDIESPACPFSVLDARAAGVLDLAWHPSGTYLAAAYTDSTARLWNPASEPPHQASTASGQAPDPLKHPVYRALSALGEAGDGKVLMHRLPDSVVLMTSYNASVTEDDIPWAAGQRPEHELRVITQAGADLLATVEWDGCIRQVYTSTQACQDFAIPSHAAVHTFDFADLNLALRRMSDGTVIRGITWQAPRCLAIDPSCSYLATGSETGHIALYALQSLEQICQIRIDEAAQACVFSASGHTLAVSSSAHDYLFRILRKEDPAPASTSTSA
jgi:WD40 repeat protein